MILKSMSRKQGNFGNLISYIARDGAVFKKDGKPFLITHNLTGTSLAGFEKQFKDNEKNRAVTRKGSVKMYHDIISWRSGDSEKITPEIVTQIAKTYAQLRNKDAIYLGALHVDKKSHPHLHLMISSTEVYTGRSIRISKAEYAEIKESLQSYEQELGIVHSAVDHGKGGRAKSDHEYQMELRSGKLSRREEVKATLEQCFADSITQGEFYENVKNSGLELYERSGKIVGVDDGRHMRFSTLGFTEEKFERMREQENRLASIGGLRGHREIGVEKEVCDIESVDETTDDTRSESEEQIEVNRDLGDR